MNVLAHLTLAGEDPQLRVGGFLGDFIKGSISDDQWPTAIADGMRLHRYIDARSNEHPAIRQAAADLRQFPRRIAPPFIDLIADYLLANDFQRWHQQPLGPFSDQAVAQLEAHRNHFNSSAARFLDRVQQLQLLVAYRHQSTMVRVAANLLQRLGNSDDLRSAFAAGLDDPAQHEHFETYYVDLQKLAQQWRADRGYP